MLLLVTGASGIGKSTVRQLIKPQVAPEVECVELAEVSPLRSTGSLAWRQQAVELCVQHAARLQHEDRHLLVCGDPVAAVEVVAAPSARLLDGYAFCLLDAAPETQAARLAARGDDPNLLVHHQAFAEWMRRQASDPLHMLEVVTTNGWDRMRWDRLRRAAMHWAVHAIDTTSWTQRPQLRLFLPGIAHCLTMSTLLNCSHSARRVHHYAQPSSCFRTCSGIVAADRYLSRDRLAQMAWIEKAFAFNWHAVRMYRLAHRLHSRGHTAAAIAISGLSRLLTGVEIEPGATLGEGLVVMHGAGLVVSEHASAGRDCVLFQGVTLGVDGRHLGGPTLGNAVTVYAGAKILGPVTVGDRATIGANSVVLRDVPAGSTAVGVPARIVGTTSTANEPAATS